MYIYISLWHLTHLSLGYPFFLPMTQCISSVDFFRRPRPAQPLAEPLNPWETACARVPGMHFGVRAMNW